MRNGRVCVAMLVTLLVIGVFASSQEQPQSVEVGILTRDGIGARALALGGAFVALVDDSTACYYNPATLASLLGTHIGGMYESKFAPSTGTSFQHLAATYRLPQTPLGGGLLLVRRSDTGIPHEGTTFSASETLILASAGYGLAGHLPVPWVDRLDIGASFKLYAHRGLADIRARGVGVDLALSGEATLQAWTVCFGYRSSDLAGATIRWSNTRNEIAEAVPWGHHLGFGASFPEWGLRVVGEFSLYPSETELNAARVGIEISLFGFALRAGLADGTPTFGAGMEILPGLSIDAALIVHGALGTSIVASSEFAF